MHITNLLMVYNCTVCISKYNYRFRQIQMMANLIKIIIEYTQVEFKSRIKKKIQEIYIISNCN